MKRLILISLALLTFFCTACAEDLGITMLEPVTVPGSEDGFETALYLGPTMGFYPSEVSLDTRNDFLYFGQFDCWAMVATGTADAPDTVGWIAAADAVLPAEPELSFEDALPVMVEEDSILTAAPFSEASLAPIAAGTQVLLLAQWDQLGYVQTELDGVPVRAFLPLSAIL